MKETLFLGLVLLLAGCGDGIVERLCGRAFECQLLDVGQSVEQCQIELQDFEADLTDDEAMRLEQAIDRCTSGPACDGFADCLADSC